ncbi:MAG TPA: hypothetical protein ENN63_12960 [Bacteroidetes bacterium]|nr:hypothetical protein [Bacteroidota bacterium]
MLHDLFIHRRGLIGTVIFHGVLLVLFLILGFSPPEVPEEEGILINFGSTETGSGLIEPSRASATPEPQPSTPPPTETRQSEEEIMTQDFEETAAVESGREETTPPEKTPEQIAREKEMERQRQEELERQRQEELERQRRLEEQRKIEEIYDRTRAALSGKNLESAQSTGEGEAGEEGNQGRTEGSVESTSRTGRGLGDEGISFDLAGRTPQYLPKPEYNYQKDGRVVVEVTVDRYGNVTKAIPGVKGSTTLDDYLLAVARKAALAAKFDPKQDAPAFQKGTITYYFILE